MGRGAGASIMGMFRRREYASMEFWYVATLGVTPLASMSPRRRRRRGRRGLHTRNFCAR